MILTTVEDGVGTLTFNRPKSLNAFNNELMRQSIDAMDAFAADDAVKAVIVRGAGRAFSAGFDLKASGERKLDSIDKVRAQMALQFDFIIKFWDSPKPTIAVVQGYCLAGAFEVALACDMTVAAQGTMFGEPEVRFGTGIVAMLMPWITGPKQAKEMLLTGDDDISAERALTMGLVNHVVDAEGCRIRAMSIARKIAANDRSAVELTKQAINRTSEIMGMRSALLQALETAVVIGAQETPESRAFNEVLERDGPKAAIAWRQKKLSAQGEPSA